MDYEETKLMVADCKKRVHKLSDWEFEFIDNLSYLTKHDPPYNLSDAQYAKLNQIWDRVTS